MVRIRSLMREIFKRDNNVAAVVAAMRKLDMKINKCNFQGTLNNRFKWLWGSGLEVGLLKNTTMTIICNITYN